MPTAIEKLAIIFLFHLSLGVFAQVGIGTTNPATSSVLELSSPNQALLITRVANVGVIASPVNGMIVYDLSSNCIKFYANNAWTGCMTAPATDDPSTNGTGVVSSYSCSTASSGTLTVGVAASGVTQTITANVTTLGTYSISTTANGVTYSGSGTFTGLGAQNIVLTATGIPTAVGIFGFALNTNPTCSFSATTIPVGSIFLGTCGSTSAITYRGNNNTRYTCTCNATDYLSGTVWGTGIYTDDSTIVRAAVHAGVIAPATAGTITFRILPGQASYTASTQNGITSFSWPSWVGSYDFN